VGVLVPDEPVRVVAALRRGSKVAAVTDDQPEAAELISDIDEEPPTRLAAFIQQVMRDKKLSLRDVAQRGGINIGSLRYYRGAGWPAKRPLSDEVVSQIAKGLDVPGYRVVEEMNASLGREPAPLGGLSPSQQTVLNTMSRLDQDAQHMVADVVMRIAQAWLSRTS